MITNPANKVTRLYNTLYRAYGPQDWWPGESDFEVMVGAVLTQNTSWKNVEKAIYNIKSAGLMNPGMLAKAGSRKLQRLIKPSGFFRVKSKRLMNLLRYLKRYEFNISAIKKLSQDRIRDELLAINGIGKETCDCIMLYALGKPVFVVDAYTRRVLTRHRMAGLRADYDDLQRIFTENLPQRSGVYNECHALLVHVGKNFCRSRKPLCRECALDSCEVDIDRSKTSY